jgi:hypothetical protein
VWTRVGWLEHKPPALRALLRRARRQGFDGKFEGVNIAYT